MSKPKVHLALYGNVGIQRGYCEKCECTALILGGEFQCCGSSCKEDPHRVKRVSQPEYRRRKPPQAEQLRILNEQDHRCFWCERRFGQFAHRYAKVVKIQCEWDHVSPYIWSADSNTNNFVASCQWCNGWKAARIFSTIEEVKIYVATKWEEATETNRKVRELQPAYGSKEILAEVLQHKVQMGSVAYGSSTSSNQEDLK